LPTLGRAGAPLFDRAIIDAMAGENARRFHDATAHSPDSVRRSGHVLDWDIKPFPFKVYPDVPATSLPREVETLDRETRAVETLMLGLRLDEPVALAVVRQLPAALGADQKFQQLVRDRHRWINPPGRPARPRPTGRCRRRRRRTRRRHRRAGSC